MITSLLLALATATPTPMASPDAIRDAVKAEVAAIKSTTTPKAYVGQIKAKTDITLTITNLAGSDRTGNLPTDAAIKLLGGKDGTVADVKVGDSVIAMGDADASGVLTIKRLVQIAKPTAEDRKIVFGSVTKASSTLLTLDSGTLKITSDTDFSGKTTIADVTAGSKIIAVTRGSTTLLVTVLK